MFVTGGKRVIGSKAGEMGRTVLRQGDGIISLVYLFYLLFFYLEHRFDFIILSLHLIYPIHFLFLV